MCVSTMATTSLEEIARVNATLPLPTPLWFQLYVLKDRAVVEDMVRAAERCGYKAIVVTVDAPR